MNNNTTNLAFSSVLDRLSIEKESTLCDSYEQPIIEMGFYGEVDKYSAPAHFFEPLLSIPKHNLILFKEYLDVDIDFRPKTFVVSCWNVSNMTLVDSIKIHDYPPFAFVKKSNCLMTGSGYGSLLAYNIIENTRLKLRKNIKSYRGTLSQIIDVVDEEKSWFGTYGYDMGSRRKYAIKIWDCMSFKLLGRIPVEVETEVNIIFIEEANQCFAVAKDCEIALFSFKNKRISQRGIIETYGKKIVRIFYEKVSHVLFAVLELERGDAFAKHEIVGWGINGEGLMEQLEMNVAVKCRNPVLLSNGKSLLGFTEKDVLTEFSFSREGSKLSRRERTKKGFDKDCTVTSIDENLLLEVYGKKKARIWKY